MRRNFQRLLRLGGSLALPVLVVGCAMLPSGPRVSHTVERFSGREDGLVEREEWRDYAFSHGFYLFTDPKLHTVNAWITNQSALGGCSHFSAGSLSVSVDTNTAAIVGATGTAVGNVVGAAVKTALK